MIAVAGRDGVRRHACGERATVECALNVAPVSGDVNVNVAVTALSTAGGRW
jgi:hypothetical protein